MTIRSGGLASGLDTNALIDKLVSLEGAPIKTLQRKVSNQTVQISTIGKIKAALQKVQDQAKGLESLEKLFTTKGTSSADTSFTVTTTAAAKPGAFDVDVTQTAKAAKMRSGGFPTASQTVLGGTLSFSINGGDPTVVTMEEGDSLDTVASRINSSIGGASATVIDDGTNRYLSVTAKDTGHKLGTDPSTAMVITENYTGTAGSRLNLATVQAAQNAKLTVDGIAVESQSNNVTGAIPNATIEVKAKTTATQTATVSVDQTAMESKISTFVQAYNDAIDLLTKETTITPGTDRSLSLAGDTTIRSIRANMSNTVTGQIGALSGKAFDSLAAIGIKTAASGKLATDSAALKAALAKDPDAVAQVFTAGGGASSRIQAGMKVYTGPLGILKARTDGLTNSNTAINDQVDKLNLRLDKYKENLVKTYTTLETTVSSLQSQQSYLSQIG